MDPELIKRYLDDQCTREELIELLEWIDTLQARKSFDEELRHEFSLPLDESDDFDIDGIYNRLKDRINIEQLISSLDRSGDHFEDTEQQTPQNDDERYTRTTRPIWGPISRVAAAIAFLLSFGFLIYLGLFSGKDNTISSPKAEWIEKRTGRGQKLTTVLPDGSKVVLNYNTILSYVGSFTDTMREVHLVGEAFFDIARDEHKPFIVRAGDLQVKVLGTLFSISTRENNDNSIVSLVSGKVEVKSLNSDQGIQDYLAMDPGEAMTYDELTGEFHRSPHIPDHFISWKDDIISFYEASYGEVCNELENWFDVQISTEGQIPSWKFTAKFEKENLVNILEGISKSQSFTYDLTDKRVIINTKK